MLGDLLFNTALKCSNRSARLCNDRRNVMELIVLPQHVEHRCNALKAKDLIWNRNCSPSNSRAKVQGVGGSARVGSPHGPGSFRHRLRSTSSQLENLTVSETAGGFSQ